MEKTTRRAVLAAAGVAALAPALPAAAAPGDPLILGQQNRSRPTTYLHSREVSLWCTAHTDDGAVVGENTFAEGYGLRATSAGIGVLAAGASIGVEAGADHGVGVAASSFDGTALQCQCSKGIALDVQGRARFSRSGRAIVPAGRDRVWVNGVELDRDSLVLATLQQDWGDVALKAAVPHPKKDSIHIVLSAPPPEDATVAWLVLG